MDATSVSAPGRAGVPPRPASGGPDDQASLTGNPGRQARGWLRAAIAAVAVLAAGSAAASWDAQYRMVDQTRHQEVVAAVEAAIPDAGALFFGCLGIALALHGRRAIRPRALNAGCVGLSLTMNAIASAPGWRSVAIWVMPSAMYAVASDTLITVIRAFTTQDEDGPLARLRRWLHQAGTGARGLLLWSLRLVLAFPSTASGFRQWVIDVGPVAPGRRSGPAHRQPDGARAAGHHTARAQPSGRRTSARPARGSTKRERLITRAGQQWGDLAALPLSQVPGVATSAAAEVGLHAGTARRYLRAHVLALQNGHGPAVEGSGAP